MIVKSKFSICVLARETLYIEREGWGAREREGEREGGRERTYVADLCD
jgi:hypothetical protein